MIYSPATLISLDDDDVLSVGLDTKTFSSMVTLLIDSLFSLRTHSHLQSYVTVKCFCTPVPNG